MQSLRVIIEWLFFFFYSVPCYCFVTRNFHLLLCVCYCCTHNWTTEHNRNFHLLLCVCYCCTQNWMTEHNRNFHLLLSVCCCCTQNWSDRAQQEFSFITVCMLLLYTELNDRAQQEFSFITVCMLLLYTELKWQSTTRMFIYYCLYVIVVHRIEVTEHNRNFHLLQCLCYCCTQNWSDKAQPAPVSQGQFPGSSHWNRKAVCAASSTEETQVTVVHFFKYSLFATDNR